MFGATGRFPVLCPRHGRPSMGCRGHLPRHAARVQARKCELSRRSRSHGSAAFIGIVAGFWHITWIAGLTFLAAALVAVGIHSAGF